MVTKSGYIDPCGDAQNMVKKCIESINNAAKIEQKCNTLYLHIAYLSSFKKGRGDRE
jgi:hypothetical protein